VPSDAVTVFTSLGAFEAEASVRASGRRVACRERRPRRRRRRIERHANGGGAGNGDPKGGRERNAVAAGDHRRRAREGRPVVLQDNQFGVHLPRRRTGEQQLETGARREGGRIQATEPSRSRTSSTAMSPPFTATMCPPACGARGCSCGRSTTATIATAPAPARRRLVLVARGAGLLLVVTVHRRPTRELPSSCVHHSRARTPWQSPPGAGRVEAPFPLGLPSTLDPVRCGARWCVSA